MKSTIILRAAVAASAVTLAAVLVACGSAVIVAQKTPAPIRLGAVYDLSGPQARLDAPSLDGALLAVDRINAQGGLLGRRVELMVRDGQGDPAVVRRVTRELTRQHVAAIIGLSDTSQVLSAAQVAAHAGIPFVTSGATSPRLPADVPDWLFLAPFGDNAQAAAGAEFAAQQLGARSAVVLYDKELESTRLLARYFAQSFRRDGGSVEVTAAFAGGDRVPPSLLTDLVRPSGDEGDTEGQGTPAAPADRRPDLIYLAAGPDDAGPLVRALRAAGYSTPILGSDSFDSAKLRRAAAGLGPVYYTTHAYIGKGHKRSPVRRFEAEYHAAYGDHPENAFACLGYDAVDLVAQAVTRAATAAPAKLLAALDGTRDFRGVTGDMSYGGGRRVPRKPVAVVQVGPPARLAAVITPRRVPRP